MEIDRDIALNLEGEHGRRLVPLAPHHLEGMWDAMQESAPELRATMPWWRDEQTKSDMSAWIAFTEAAWRDGQLFAFSIEDGKGRYLGSCSLEGVDWDRSVANISFWVRTSETRRGIASRSAREIARWGCRTLGLQRLEISMVTSNESSIGAARKSGARFEGVLRNRARWGGVSHDMAMFSFTPKDFS